MNIWIASLAAVLVQPLVFIARLAPELLASSQPVYGLGFALIAVAVVASAIVLVLGIPSYLVLRKFGLERWPLLALVGTVLGALPAAFGWPSQQEGYSAGQNWHGRYVDTYVNGSPTEYAWLTYGEGVFFFAIHGLIGALVFHAVLHMREHRAKAASRNQPT